MQQLAYILAMQQPLTVDLQQLPLTWQNIAVSFRKTNIANKQLHEMFTKKKSCKSTNVNRYGIRIFSTLRYMQPFSLHPVTIIFVAVRSIANDSISLWTPLGMETTHFPFDARALTDNSDSTCTMFGEPASSVFFANYM